MIISGNTLKSSYFRGIAKSCGITVTNVIKPGLIQSNNQFFLSGRSDRVSRVGFFDYSQYMHFFIFFRYKCLKMGCWMNESILIRYSNIIFCFALFYGASLVLADFLFDIRMFNLILICEKGEEAEEMNSRLNSILIVVPILGLVFSTSILDFKSYRLAKSRVGTFQDPVPKIDKIPFYASITSTTMLVPYFFMAMALGNLISNFSPVSKFYVIMVLSTVVNMLRNPLTGLH